MSAPMAKSSSPAIYSIIRRRRGIMHGHVTFSDVPAVASKSVASASKPALNARAPLNPAALNMRNYYFAHKGDARLNLASAGCAAGTARTVDPVQPSNASLTLLIGKRFKRRPLGV